jgi:hypothetical protein
MTTEEAQAEIDAARIHDAGIAAAELVHGRRGSLETSRWIASV